MISYGRGDSLPVSLTASAELERRNLKASACSVSARSARPVILRFSRTIFNTLWFSSMKVALAAPRLNASMPTLPVPAKRSRKRASSTRVERISNSAVLTRSMMGRVPGVLGDFSLRPFASPVTTRIAPLSPLFFAQNGQHRAHFILEVVLFGPRDQRLHLVLLELFIRRGVPDTLKQLLKLFVADLVAKHVMQNIDAARAGGRRAMNGSQIVDLDARQRR